MTRGIVAHYRIGQIRLNARTGIGSRMDLTHLVAGRLLLVGLAGSKDHTQAQGKHQKKAQDALFHLHHVSFHTF